MIESISISLSCAVCGKSTESSDIKPEGSLAWHQISCACGAEYEQALAVSHQTRFPIIRSKKPLSLSDQYSSSKKIESRYYYYDSLIEWQIAPLTEATKGKATYHTVRFAEATKVRVFNCLDSCYGHALLRLLQTYPHLQQSDYGVVVIIPEVLRWMLPKGICAALMVKSSLSQLKYPLENFDAVATEFLIVYEEVEFDSLPLDFDYEKNPVEIFTGVKPFERLHKDFKQLTILWREDRFWLRSKTGERLAKFYYKYKWNWLKTVLLNWQKNNYRQVVFALKKNHPELNVTIAGVSSSNPGISWAEDKRIRKPDANDEKNWCTLFASSDLVIGIHGSHMLLPTALAGAFIELLPEWKIMHQGEDILYNRSDLERRTLARIVPSRSSIGEVAAHAEAVLGWWSRLY